MMKNMINDAVIMDHGRHAWVTSPSKAKRGDECMLPLARWPGVQIAELPPLPRPRLGFFTALN